MTDINPKLLWIHCNRCYELYVFKKHIFYLLACQHVICEKCCSVSLGRTSADSPTYKCPFCKQSVRGRAINNAMPPNLKEYFHPEPWRDGVNHQMVENFQKAHRTHLEKYMLKQDQNIRKIEQDTKLLHETCRKTYLELDQVRADRRQLEHRVNQIKRQRQRETEERAKRLANDRNGQAASVNSEQSFIGTFAGLGGMTASRSRYPASMSMAAAATAASTPYGLAGPRMPHPLTNERPTATFLTTDNITSFVHPPNHSFNL